jgi:16S rRNA C967 or C1407 C5-methylase (RsmB/RsmF family)
VLPEENGDQIAAFLSGTAGFQPANLRAPDTGLASLIERCRLEGGPGVQLSPLRAGCDGFFIAALQRVT